MNIRITSLLILIVSGCASTQDNSTQNYKWSDNVNYSEMRRKIGWSDSYDSICTHGRPLAAMGQAMNNDEWKRAVVLGKAWLGKCPIDIRVHYYLGISLENLGLEVESKDHFRWVKGLMDDLVASGDGESPETAYEVISVSEEYDAIYFFGLKKKSQALVSGDIMSDLIVAIDDKGGEVSIYFNPAAHFARLAKRFR